MLLMNVLSRIFNFSFLKYIHFDLAKKQTYEVKRVYNNLSSSRIDFQET